METKLKVITRKESPENKKELQKQLKLSKERREPRMKMLVHLPNKLKLRMLLKKRRIESKLKKKQSEIKNQKIMMRRKSQNTLSSVLTLSNSMEISQQGSLDKLLLLMEKKEPKEMQLLNLNQYLKRKAMLAMFYQQNLWLQRLLKEEEF